MSYYQWQFLLVALAGWINRHQQDVIAYLKEENRVQRELLGRKRPRFSDDHRRRLAAKAKVLGRSALEALDSMVTPMRLLHQRLQSQGHHACRSQGNHTQLPPRHSPPSYRGGLAAR